MRTVSKILSAVLALFFIWNVYFYFANRDTTEIVTYGSIRDMISVEGQIIKEELPVKAPADGVLQPYLTDCEKAGKETAIAAILSGETDENSKKRLTELGSRIASLEETLESRAFEDVMALDTSISDQVNQVIAYSGNGNFTRVSEYKNDIIKLLDKRSCATNDNGKEILKTLNEEKKELEVSLGNLINEVIAPSSGVFSARLDGLEEKYTPQNLGDLTLSSLEEIKKTKPYKMSKVSKGDNVLKIINNFSWYLAVAIDKKEVEEIEKGDSMRISFRDAGGEIANATVYDILDEESGKNIVIFHLNRDVGGILSRRNVSIDIIKRTWEGFKLPLGALVYENEQTGVYVINGGEKIFKPIEVLYHNENYLIAKEDNSLEGGLLLYDTVAVNGDVK